jgi:hypothetical protein
VGKRRFASAGSYRTATRMGWTASLPGRLLSTSDWQAGRQSESAGTCAKTTPLSDRDKRVMVLSSREKSLRRPQSLSVALQQHVVVHNRVNIR